MRHERSHHVLNHHELRSGIPADSKAQELEADDRATIWMNGGHAAEPVGQFGARPSPSEMELERRALVMLVGMIWVPQFELGPHGKSATHPDGGHENERDGRASCACPGQFCGRDPVVLVKVLIDPDGHWPVDSESPYAIGWPNFGRSSFGAARGSASFDPSLEDPNSDSWLSADALRAILNRSRGDRGVA
jgi:hypothetical protein